MMTVLPLTEENIEDAKTVIRDRFNENACRLLDKEMRNPLRCLNSEVGDIIYDQNLPICFQACILRRVYWRMKEIVGTVGGLTCLKQGAPVEAMIDIRTASNKSRGGSVFGFGNSLNRASAAITRKLKTRHAGPESCSVFLWRALRPIECLTYFLRRKFFHLGLPEWKSFSTLSSTDFAIDGDVSVRRLMKIETSFFDRLMDEYLKTNEGLVCSRRTEEIEWIFGDRIENGQTVILGAFENDRPVGYTVIKCGENSKRCLLVDWFALRNDARLLNVLMDAAVKFLRHHTPAMMLEASGFSTYGSSILKKWLPHVRPVGHNQFSWGSKNKEFRESILPIIDTPKSWFFGPYDGDVCLF